MLNLTTLDPTIQQTLHQYGLEILTRQIQIQFAPVDPIEPFIGLIQSDHPDWLDHHDDYLGQTLHTEMA